MDSALANRAVMSEQEGKPVMKLNELSPAPGSRKDSVRKGRGIGSGNGKTAGRGHKGQHARSGGFHKVGFEGGQMALQRRLPKAGFKNNLRKIYALVSVGDLEAKFSAGDEVRVENLVSQGLVRKSFGDGVKLLADGELTKSLNIFVDKASQSAIAKVQAAGGRITLNVIETETVEAE